MRRTMVAGKFETRQAVPEDADAIALAHLDSIRSIGPRFYSPDIVKIWGAGITPDIYVNAMCGGEAFFIAIGQLDDRPAVLGFSSHRVDDAQDGTSVYVRGSAARRGIGTALLQLAEAHALAHGATVVQIQASLAGVDFYKVNGYEELGRGDAYLMSGHSMPLCAHAQGADMTISRRGLMRGLIALGPAVVSTTSGAAGASQRSRVPRAADAVAYDPGVLPSGIRSRFVSNINGLRMHVLEAGFETSGRPAVLLLHGFPELAYSWRKVMVPIASAGYHVIAPDRRGYGRTSGWDVGYDDDLGPFGTLNQIRDALELVSAFGYRSLAAVIGHDQGSPLAGWCAVARPDVFRSVAMMSAPFLGAPVLPFNTANAPAAAPPAAATDKIYDDLSKLTPPRKHYQRYYQTREANENIWHPPQGVHAFLRAYYHMKSADWAPNDPHPLAARTAGEWAKLPRYYVMDLNKGMAETVAAEMPSSAQIAACRWLPDAELRVYSEEYGRTGFQGGLNGYRRGRVDADLQLFAGKTIDVPATFISGKKDWGVYQNPGALEQLEKVHTTKYRGTDLVDGAGHWVQQEQPEQVSALLMAFLKKQS